MGGFRGLREFRVELAEWLRGLGVFGFGLRVPPQTLTHSGARACVGLEEKNFAFQCVLGLGLTGGGEGFRGPEPSHKTTNSKLRSDMLQKCPWPLVHMLEAIAEHPQKKHKLGEESPGSGM